MKDKEQLNPLEAIRKKCVEDCCSGNFFEVKHCMCPSCPLYEFRFGKNPYRKEVSEERRKAASERMKQMQAKKKLANQ